MSREYYTNRLGLRPLMLYPDRISVFIREIKSSKIKAIELDGLVALSPAQLKVVLPFEFVDETLKSDQSNMANEQYFYLFLFDFRHFCN